MKRIFSADEFEDDLKRMAHRGNKIEKAHALVEHMREKGQAPPSAKPHKLNGEWFGHWECHIGFDWLLIYTIDKDTLVIRRTGTHNDLFG